MSKTFIIIVLFGVLFFVGCCSVLSPQPTQSIVCNKPYIQVGNSCCLDKDNNGICDNDERSISSENRAETAANQILSSGCQYNNPVCPSDYDCLGNQCILKKGCQYNNPACAANYECTNNQCVQRECPYECCDGSDFKVKTCQLDYKCDAHLCKPIDTDSDGLFDYEEKILGTNPSIADTDGDGWNDFTEVKIKHTDPLNANMDNDRYIDSQDPNPTKKNSANISNVMEKTTADKNLPAIAAAAIAAAGAPETGGATLAAVTQVIGSDTWLYKFTWFFNFANTGDDYTTDYQADFVVYYKGKTFNTRNDIIADFKTNQSSWKKVHTEHFSLGKINAGETRTKNFEYLSLVKDVPENLINIVLNGGSTAFGVIENEQYEKYT